MHVDGQDDVGVGVQQGVGHQLGAGELGRLQPALAVGLREHLPQECTGDPSARRVLRQRQNPVGADVIAGSIGGGSLS